MTLNLESICWDGLFPRIAASGNASDFTRTHGGANILVTGAGGSIGSALAETLYPLNPHNLVLLDSSEQNLYRIHSKLSSLSGRERHVPVLGSVADERCLRDLFERYQPEIIYHAAALKHVPLGEMNPFAVVQNNAFGTSILAMMARHFVAKRLITISTDKAVNSRSIMGASKRLAEIVLLAAGSAETRMTSIRLGNVLASEGSVVPLFLEQIARGGPLTVTDPEVDRYFLTMEETVHRILNACIACPAGGSVSVPVMGEPVKIAALAQYLIEQTSANGVGITYTGLRPGDKLQEEFVAQDETLSGLPANGIQWIMSPHLAEADLTVGLAELNEAMEEMNIAKLLATLTRLVPEYQPSALLQQQASAGAAH
ncbi:MAG: polysaccharide biosynthesis protein [Candidatus Korobacteraceae bacterium]